MAHFFRPHDCFAKIETEVKNLSNPLRGAELSSSVLLASLVTGMSLHVAGDMIKSAANKCTDAGQRKILLNLASDFASAHLFGRRYLFPKHQLHLQDGTPDAIRKTITQHIGEWLAGDTNQTKYKTIHQDLSQIFKTEAVEEAIDKLPKAKIRAKAKDKSEAKFVPHPLASIIRDLSRTCKNTKTLHRMLLWAADDFVFHTKSRDSQLILYSLADLLIFLIDKGHLTELPSHQPCQQALHCCSVCNRLIDINEKLCSHHHTRKKTTQYDKAKRQIRYAKKIIRNIDNIEILTSIRLQQPAEFYHSLSTIPMTQALLPTPAKTINWSDYITIVIHKLDLCDEFFIAKAIRSGDTHSLSLATSMRWHEALLMVKTEQQKHPGPGRPPKCDHEEVFKLKKQGIKVAEIASRMGFTRQHIYNILSRSK